MTEPAEPEVGHCPAAVLIITANHTIESLLAELVAFAEHQPIFDVTGGAAGETIRRVRPNVVLLDAAVPDGVITGCLRAGEEVGSAMILVSSTASASELSEQARLYGCAHFPLPSGPLPLAALIHSVWAAQPSCPVVPFRLQRRHPVHPAFCAAVASVARARALALRAEASLHQSRMLRAQMEMVRAESDRSRGALRAAVSDYTTQLKASALPLDRVVVMVHDAISDCALVVGAEPATPALLLESEEWARAAFAAA